MKRTIPIAILQIVILAALLIGCEKRLNGYERSKLERAPKFEQANVQWDEVHLQYEIAYGWAWEGKSIDADKYNELEAYGTLMDLVLEHAEGYALLDVPWDKKMKSWATAGIALQFKNHLIDIYERDRLLRVVEEFSETLEWIHNN